VKESLDWEFDVEWVKNYDQLRSELEDNFFSVIVTDVSIDSSSEDGYEIIDNIRVKRRITRTPVIVYSGVKNMQEIERTNKNLFFAYLTKGTRNWLSKLEELCLKASKQDRHLSSWKTLEAYFEKIKILDLPLKGLEIPQNQLFTGLLDLGKNPTWRYVISLVDDTHIDDIAWRELENIAMEKYEKHSRMIST
jgi:CheY-like chemotaxis protein